MASTFAGHDALKFYGEPIDPERAVVVDFDLADLPEDCNEDTIRKIADAKHVIKAEVLSDNLTGACKGFGRIKLRMNKDDDFEKVK